MKRKYIYIGIICMILIAIGTNKKIKETFLFNTTKMFTSNKQELWFHCPKVDSVFNDDKFHYFLFCNEKDLLMDKDSTLLILNEDIYCTDSIASSMKNKIYLPSSAFSFLMQEGDKFMLSRIVSIEKENNMTKYKLRKVDL